MMSKKEHVKLPNGLEGYLFRPTTYESAACVIILHERFGLVEHNLDLAEKLAVDGYFTLAPDLFSLWEGDKEALKRGDVRATVSDADCTEQVDLWVNYLKENVFSGNNAKIALMGMCQSGRYPVVVGSQRKDLSACIVFYGAARDKDWNAGDLQPRSMPEMIANLTAPLFFIYGEKDHTISLEDVLRMRNTVEKSDISYRMKVMPDAPHAFLNDTMPKRYRPEQAQQAWQLLLDFLQDVFNTGWPQDEVIWDFKSCVAKDYDFKKNSA